jgi:hypothetical protein
MGMHGKSLGTVMEMHEQDMGISGMSMGNMNNAWLLHS